MTGPAVDPQRLSPRMHIEPAGPVRALIDGTWRPQTRDLPQELPAIWQTVGARLSHPERVGYNLNDWNPVTADVFINDRRVRLEGFTNWTSATVRFVGENGSLLIALLPADIKTRPTCDGRTYAGGPAGAQSVHVSGETQLSAAEHEWDTEGGHQ